MLEVHSIKKILKRNNSYYPADQEVNSHIKDSPTNNARITKHLAIEEEDSGAKPSNRASVEGINQQERVGTIQGGNMTLEEME